VKLKTESRVKLRFPTKKLNRRTSVRVCDLSGQMDFPFALAPICMLSTTHSFGNSAGKKLKLKTQSTWNGIAIMGATDMHMCGKCSNILLPFRKKCGGIEGCFIRRGNKHSIKAYFCVPQNGVAVFHTVADLHGQVESYRFLITPLYSSFLYENITFLTDS